MRDIVLFRASTPDSKPGSSGVSDLSTPDSTPGSSDSPIGPLLKVFSLVFRLSIPIHGQKAWRT